MRELEFRGISLKTGKFVYGDIAYNPIKTGYFIHESWDIPPSMSEPGGDVHYQIHEVDPKTIDQYTGLKDRADKKIFENDILENIKSAKGNFFIKFNCGGYDAVYKGNFTLCLHPVLSDFDGATIIGNVHQNPELLP